MDVRATLQAATRTPDGGGGFTVTWETVATVWIALDATTGDNDFGPDRSEPRTQYRVTLRRRADVAPGMRLVTAARTLWIGNVLDDGARSQIMTLLCRDAP